MFEDLAQSGQEAGEVLQLAGLGGFRIHEPDPLTGEGEIVVKGANVMKGYYNKPEATAEAFKGTSWFHTGDLGRKDEDGYVYIVDRVKDMIIRGGFNVYPREVEEFLYTHPAINEVQVFGIPDPRMGEEVCAWIQLEEGASLTEEEVKAFCKGQITHFKVPKYVRFVDEWPISSTKIQKFKLSEMSVDIWPDRV